MDTPQVTLISLAGSQREGQMFKIMIIATVAALPLLYVIDAKAQSGACPAGTCAKSGGQHAANLQNCSAANCKKPQGSQVSGGSKCRAGNPEFKDYVGCIDYNLKLGNTDASRYCQRQCPRG